ncbi:MAG: YqhA family protein [Coriobacteriia bacterium]|nr:YqhA family protein [Coriobacteriia bacterium]
MSEAPESVVESVRENDPRGKSNAFVGRVASFTRFFILIPITGLAIAAVVMTAVAVLDVFKLTMEAITHHASMTTLIVGFIEVADVFLLSVVLYIMGVGLYELFIDDNLPLPSWLVIHNLEDLKEKLVGVVIVVLAVFFLGRVIESDSAIDVLYLGGGIALIIAALSYFASRVLEGHKK